MTVDNELREAIEKVIDKNCWEVEWEGTCVDKETMLDQICQLLEQQRRPITKSKDEDSSSDQIFWNG